MTVLVDLGMTTESGIPDMPAFDDLTVAGSDVVLQEVARRWICVRGSLWEAPETGEALLSQQGEGLTLAQVTTLEGRLRSAALDVEGVDDCDVVVELNATTETLTAKGSVTLLSGEIRELVTLLTTDVVTGLVTLDG